jgi:hypothetical protein
MKNGIIMIRDGCVRQMGTWTGRQRGDPVRQGFDEFYGYNSQLESHRYYPTHLWDNDQKIPLEQNGQLEYENLYVGQIMAILKEKGLDKNTLVVFTSDNGPHKEGGNDPPFFDRVGFSGI